MSAGPILVCGLGQVGYRAASLLRQLGEEVRVVTTGARDEWRHAVEAAGARVLIGDARDSAVLQKAGLAEARAILALTSHDLVNVEIALDCRRIRPELPVVLRLFDQELARHLESGFGVRRALGVSALAAPTFAAAALGERWLGHFTWAGEEFVIGRLKLEATSPLVGRPVREIPSGGDLAVVRYEAPVSQGAKPSGIAEPDAALEPGGRLTIVAARQRWERLFAEAAPTTPAARDRGRAGPARGSGIGRSFDVVRAAWRGVPAALRTAVLVLFLVIALSVGVFRVSLGLTLVDAFYFIVTTVTTTGYGDITPLHAGAAVKIYACLVMVLGSAATALLYSIITDYVVRARFRELLGRERATGSGHVVVAGLGNVGYRIVEELLRAGARLAVVVRDDAGEFVEAVRGRVALVIGDARLRDILERAGVGRAAAVVAATGDDAVNLGIALAARELCPGIRTDVRLFDADFARKARSAFALDAAMSASLLAAPMFVASAFAEGVVAAFIEDEKTLVTLRVASVPPGSGRLDDGTVLLRRSARASPATTEGDLAADGTLLVETRSIARPLPPV